MHDSLFCTACIEARAAHSQGPQRACHEHTVELTFVEMGRDLCDVEGERLACSAGEYSIIPPHHEHSSWTDDSAVSFASIHLRASLLDDIAGELGAEKNSALPVGSFVTTPSMHGAYRLLKSELAHHDGAHELAVQSISHHLAALLVRAHLLLKHTQAPQSSASRVQRAEEKIRADHAEALSLDELAQIAGLSTMHFVRAFKKVYGTSPYAYLLDVRLERAQLLMKDRDVPLTRIAFDVGFGSQSRFTEAFRRRYGVTPSTFRAQGQPARSDARSGRGAATSV